MKKADEIMELLSEELAGFEESVKKLEVLSKDLKEVKVQADSSKVERMLIEHLGEMRIIFREHKQLLEGIKLDIGNAQLIPKWLLVLFFLSLALLLLLIGYLAYRSIKV